MQSGNEQHGDPQREPKSILIKIFPDKCIGAGHCVVCASDIFTQNDDDGVVILLNENPTPDRYEAAKEAARMCPTSAIEVIEEQRQ